jgi:Mce-associated membrane protein
VSTDDKADATGHATDEATHEATDEPTVEATDDVTAEPTGAEETHKADETVDEATAVDEQPDETSNGIARRSRRTIGGKVAAIALAVVLLASAGVTAWLYFKQYRPDQQTNDAAATVALNAAKSGTVALLSYSPDTLDKDFAAAKSHLTGDFLTYYTQFTQQIVTPAAKQKSVKTSAAVVRAAVADLHPDSAMVLVFINQNTVSKENPDGSFAASAVKVGLKKIDNAWLISSFDPV